ncbi:hypothetical protein L1887_48035 [Cichorium endivia]|nr:hypothetical protein L1887_48035 [Cichorium endivia]
MLRVRSRASKLAGRGSSNNIRGSEFRYAPCRRDPEQVRLSVNLRYRKGCLRWEPRIASAQGSKSKESGSACCTRLLLLVPTARSMNDARWTRKEDAKQDTPQTSKEGLQTLIKPEPAAIQTIQTIRESGTGHTGSPK